MIHQLKMVLDDLSRKHKSKTSRSENTKYIRCLTTLDLSLLGIAAVVNSGLYIVVGKLSRDVAGPAIILSFGLAGLSSLFSGLCYAEFGSRVQKSGSAYVYTYLSLGEIWAFIAGWNMILEYIITIATLCTASSEYINSLSGGFIYQHFLEKLSWWDTPALAKFPDLLGLFILIFLAIIVGLGVKCSSIFQNSITGINIAVVLFMICVGSYFADTSNWASWDKFAPYGFQGIITAAGSCFYAFVGFDVIGTAAEETINPKTALPTSILISIGVGFLSYFGVSTVLTLMEPYDKLDKFAPLAEAFAQRGFVGAKYIVDIGAIASCLTSLLAMLFATPRLIQAISSDGLLFQWLDSINSKTHVPLRALVCCTAISGVLALILNLQQLIEMLSIGTLTAYTLVAIGVLLTRYQCDVESVYDHQDPKLASNEKGSNGVIVWLKTLYCKDEQNDSKEHEAKYTQLTTCDNPIEEAPPNDHEQLENNGGPTEESSFHASLVTFVLSVALIILSMMISFAHNEIKLLKGWAIVLTCASGATVISVIVFLYRLPRNSATFPFMVPFPPVICTFTLGINFFLILNLNHWTYVRFGVWMFIGSLIYVFYGRTHSKEAFENQSDDTDDIH